MNKFIQLCIALALCCQVVSVSHAFEKDIDDEILRVYGNACEKTSKDEPRSSTRVRVTDKASFAAAENIPEVVALKSTLDEHDFSILVYNLVDNYLSDVAVKTIVEDGRELCVEVKGNIKIADISIAQDEVLSRKPKQNVVVEDESNKQETEEENPTKLITPQGDNNFVRAKIYFQPTHFYNGTNSNNLANVLKQFFKDKQNIEIAENIKDANYVVYSEVLRAKVDQINDEKSRLQMVTSLELRDNSGKSLAMEHQNRFVLFSVEDNEQEVAFRLLKKLFMNMAPILYKKIEKNSGHNG